MPPRRLPRHRPTEDGMIVGLRVTLGVAIAMVTSLVLVPTLLRDVYLGFEEILQGHPLDFPRNNSDAAAFPLLHDDDHPDEPASTTTTTTDNNASTTIMTNNNNKTQESFLAPSERCCYRSDANPDDTLTAEFFAEERRKAIGTPKESLWTGNEHEDWRAFAEGTPLGRAVTGRSLEDDAFDRCEADWTRVVLGLQHGFYLRNVVDALKREGGDVGFRYVRDLPGIPRVLLLGDSISQGIWMWTQARFSWLNLTNIHAAPANCHGFDYYSQHLDAWLGDCPWDLIQFNVGMHFHPDNDGWEPYKDGIRKIVGRMREHSPAAAIVFAATTPTPFDSEATTPDKATCPHYDLFHPGGFVEQMNGVAKAVGEELGVSFNDRYAAILPELRVHQKPCDIHFTTEGYQLLARQDYKHLCDRLNITIPAF